MATTYERIRTALQQASRQNSWPAREALAGEIRKRKLAAFRIRGTGDTKDDYTKEKTIERLLNLLVDLGLLSIATNSTIRITERGRNCLTSDETYSLQIQSSVKTYLENHDLPLEVIHARIKKIRLPDVPDAATIYNRLPKSKTLEIDESQLRRALFLLACAQGITRKVKVHYQAEQIQQ